jgi:hypothetical protein
MNASPDVCAIGDDGYCVLDLARPKANEKIEEILAEFGARDHLHSRSLTFSGRNGRHIDLEVPARH